jgi:hypothetical protein
LWKDVHDREALMPMAFAPAISEEAYVFLPLARFLGVQGL